MRLSFRLFVHRVGLLSLSTLLASGLIPMAQGQTAPSILPSVVKLVAGGGTATIAAGAKCPVSGNTATDSYGDGCLATEIELGNVAAKATTPGARAATMDIEGNIFFTDYNNNLVRRIDAKTGVVAAVAGGASSSPASGASCGALISTDARGNGCLSTAVLLAGPIALAFAANGDLYFTEGKGYDVRKISATNGLIPDTGGLISNVAGSPTLTYGYTASNSSATIIAATQSYLDVPTSLAFDAQGNLFIAEEYKEAILVVNTNTSGSTTVNGVTIPAGTIWRVAGAFTGGIDCVNGTYPSTSSTYGCSYGKYTEGVQATTTFLDNPYGVAVDSAGNTYFSNEYYESVGAISTSGVLSTYAGIFASSAHQANTLRSSSTASGIGSPFGIATDAQDNLYINDATAGIIWRVDATSKLMYAVAGGASTVCTGATDTLGDGCPGTQAAFYAASASTTYSSTTLPGPGLYGLNIDAYSDIFVGDTENNNVREVVSGTWFGKTGTAATTNNVIIHFAKGDSELSAGFVVTDGSSIFTVGTPSCVTNSDTTRDCTIAVTATPGTAGEYTGTLKVTSTLGGSATFPLGGYAVASPVTTTALAVSAGCTSGVYSSSTTVTLTATVTAYTTMTGSVQFYNNGVAFGTAQVLSSSNTATLSQTFPAGSYSFTATYLGDTNTNASTSTAVAFSTADASFGLSSINSGAQSTVTAGKTALYSFVVAAGSYAGTLSFACSGLPSGASCIFSPNTYTFTQCDTSATIALSILTSANPTTLASKKTGLAGMIGSSALALGTALFALAMGMRRRKLGAGFGTALLVFGALLATTGLTACSSTISDKSIPSPSGTYTVTVTMSGSPTANTTTGSSQTFTLPLTIQ